MCLWGFLLFLKCRHLVFRLKTIDVVIRNTKDAEDALKSYETRLRNVSKVPGDEKEVEDQRSQLKVSRCFCISRFVSVADCFIFVVTLLFSLCSPCVPKQRPTR